MIKPLIKRIQGLHRFIARWWYAPLLGFLSLIDHFVVVFPVDGMLISSILIRKQNWKRLTFWVWLGSSVGTWLIAGLAAVYGYPFVQQVFPGLLETGLWKWALQFFTNHGMWLLFISGLLPLAQQPAAIVVGMAGAPLWKVAAVIFVARGLKFAILGYLSAKAPHLLKKLWGVREEIHDLEEPPGFKPNP